MPESWQEWLATYRATKPMEREVSPLRDILDDPEDAKPERRWRMREDGNLGRDDNGFFAMVGSVIRRLVRGTYVSWKQPLMKQTGVGALVLFQSVDSRWFLVQALEEAGNPEEGGRALVLLAPTFQAGKSNLEGKHGFNALPYTEFVRAAQDTGRIQWMRLWQDGGRFLEKANDFGIIQLTSEEEAALEVDHTRWRWMDVAELKQAFLAGELNEHLSQLLLYGMFADVVHIPIYTLDP